MEENDFFEYLTQLMDDFKLDKNTKLRKAIENEINKKTHVEKIIKSTPSIKLKEGALNFINFMKEQNIHNREYFTKQIIDDLNDEYVIFQDIDIISEILIDIKKIIIQDLNNYILLIIYYICNNLNEKINKAKQNFLDLFVFVIKYLNINFDDDISKMLIYVSYIYDNLKKTDLNIFYNSNDDELLSLNKTIKINSINYEITFELDKLNIKEYINEDEFEEDFGEEY